MDARLHADRRDGRRQRRHRARWRELPAGAFAEVDGGAVLVLADRLVPWSAAGYGSPVDRPGTGEATVLTPRSTVAVLRHGFRPVVHPTAAAPGVTGEP
jgi:hypothetical protein